MVGSDEADPVAAAAALARGAPLPPLLQSGMADRGGLLKHYLLLHDAAGAASLAECAATPSAPAAVLNP